MHISKIISRRKPLFSLAMIFHLFVSMAYSQPVLYGSDMEIWHVSGNNWLYAPDGWYGFQSIFPDCIRQDTQAYMGNYAVKLIGTNDSSALTIVPYLKTDRLFSNISPDRLVYAMKTNLSHPDDSIEVKITFCADPYPYGDSVVYEEKKYITQTFSSWVLDTLRINPVISTIHFDFIRIWFWNRNDTSTWISLDEIYFEGAILPVNSTEMDMKNDNFYFFPNPADQFVYAGNQNNEFMPTTIRIYSSLGELLAVQKYTNRIDIQKLGAGKYFVEFIDKHELRQYASFVKK